MALKAETCCQHMLVCRFKQLGLVYVALLYPALQTDPYWQVLASDKITGLTAEEYNIT